MNSQEFMISCLNLFKRSLNNKETIILSNLLLLTLQPLYDLYCICGCINNLCRHLFGVNCLYRKMFFIVKKKFLIFFLDSIDK